MKKHLQKLLLLVAFLMPWAVNAQVQLTVANGTVTNEYVPIYGYYADAYLRAQMIYPGSDLSAMTGDTITSMTFYANAFADWGSVTFQVKVGTTAASTLSDWSTETLTTVYNGVPSMNSSNQMVINFTTPYTYTGGNLLVEFVSTSPDDYDYSYWYGITSTGSSVQGYDYDDVSYAYADQQDFLPKVTFTYAPSSQSCPMPFGLTASNITLSSADITWRDTANAGAYRLYWAPADTLSLIDSVDVYDTAYSITGLYEYENYVVKVKSLCTTEESFLTQITFQTLSTVLHYNMTASFDSIRTCNAVIYDNGGPNGSYANNSNNTLVIRSNSPDSALILSGTYVGEGCCDYLSIYEGVGTNGTRLHYGSSPSSGTVVNIGPLISEMGFTIVFTSDVSVNNGGYELSVNCFSNSCPRSSNFHAVAVSSDEVTLGWTPGINDIQWTIDTNGVSNDFYDSTATFYNLTPNTNYTFTLRGVCGVDDTSLAVTLTLRTPCVALDSLPYTQDFEAATVGGSQSATFVNCMTRLNNGSSYYGWPYVSSTASYNHTTGGGKGLYWYNSITTNTYGDYQIVVLPGVDTDMYAMNTLQLNFWAKATSTSYSPVFQVGVMTNPNDISTFQLVQTVNVGNSGQWNIFEIPFSSFTGNGQYVAIRANRPTSSWYASVDDITLMEIPACPHVGNLHFDSMSVDWAAIGWTEVGTASSWYVEYDTVAFTPGAGTATFTDVAYDTTYLLNYLDTGRTYYVYVAADCNGDPSPWESLTLTTLASLPATMPYSCTFEGSGTNGWDFVNGSQTNYWMVGTATNNGGTKSMYITNNGTANAYTVGSQSIVYATRIFNLADTGEYLYSYDWKAYGESNYDYIRAWLAPATATLTAGQLPDGSTSPYNYTSTTPAGWISLDGGTKLNLQSSWQNRTSTFQLNQVGAYQLVFMWANDGSGGSTPPAAIDNIQFIRNSCPQPTGITVTGVTDNSISLSWHAGGSESSWSVFDGTNYYISTDTNYTLMGLNSDVTYNISVRALCDDGDSSLAILASARTLMTCPRPINFVVTHVWGDTVSLTWRDTTNASSFDLVYGQTGFDPDTVVSNFVYGVIDSNYTFTGLTIGQPYQFYVRTNCASDDSRWEGPVSAVPGYVMSMAATGTRTIHNACGYTIYDDGGATGDYSTNCNSTLTLYPDTGYILRMYGTCNTENNYDYLRIYDGPDANSTMVFESSGTNTIDTITATRGPLTIVFTSDNSVVYPGFELHTICEPAPDCGQVVDLAVTAGPASAMVTWSPSVNDINTYSGAVVEYKEASDTTWTTLNTTGTSIAISGLTANTVYDLRVSTECSGSTSSWLTDQFTTRGYGCAEVSGTAIDTIGTGTATNGYIPSYGFYNYSLSQQIFTAAEITGSGNITSIAVMPSAVASQRTYEIYLAHTTQTSLSGFIHPSDMVRVYDGAPNTMTANQWVTFNFDTPFNYNGTDNLLVCFRDITGSYASGTSWYVHSSTGNSVYTYSDDGAFDPFTTTGGTTVASRNNIIITAEACARLSTCAAPPTLVENVTPTSVDLVWAAAGTESSWSIYVMGENDTVYTFLDTTTLTSYQVTGLTPAFQYRFKIMANCGTDSSATVVDATTACAPVALPYTENFENYGGIYDRICWTIGTTNLGTEAPYPLVVNLTGDPNKLCLFYNGAYAVMPRMGAPLNQLQIRFNFTQGGDNVRFLMGLMDDPLAPIDSLRVLDTIIRSQYDTVNSTIGYTYRFNQLSESDTAAYIAFWDAFNDNYSFIDDLVVEYIPNCLPVTGVTVSNVTTTSATVNWVDNDNFSASYIVEYGPHGFVPGTGTVDSAATMPYTLTGLTHSTRYDVYVYAICGADTATAAPVVNFTTQCDAVTVLPYFTNFEGYVSPGSTATNVLPNCWSTEATNAYIYYNTNTSQAPSPSYALQLMGNGLVALPEMGVPLDSLMVTFHDYKSAGLGLIVGAINTTAPGSLSGQFVPVDTILFANGVTQTTVTSYLTDYSGTGTRIAIKAFGNTGTGVSHYIDNLTIDRISGCIAPQHVQCAQLTGTSADIVWRISQASSYSVEYGVHGYTPGAGTTVTTATRSVSLTGLTPQTQYDVRIVALCGADTSDTVLFTFTTACDYVTIPYLQTFEAATTGSSTSATFVSCMTRLNNGTSYYGYPYVGGSTYNHTSGGSKGLYWCNSITTGTYGDYQCVVLPPVNPTMGVDTLQLSFWAKASSASYTPVFQVGVMTDPTNIATFVGVDTISLTSGTTWTLVEVPLTTYTGNGLYVAIKADRPASSWYAYVDDISLDIAPSCISPRNIFATAASSTSLTIDWVEATPATNWQVEYGPANYTLGSATGTLISTTTHPVTVTGLDTLTSYDFYVRPICSATDTGAWSSSARFTTAMCDNAEIAAIGSESSSSTSYYYPVNNYFRYTLSETIIDSAELGGPMDISFIGYYYNYSSAMSAKTNCTIYFQPTTRSTFGTSSDIVTVDTSIAVKVYEGAFNFSQGWNFLPLDTVYSYSGHGNLMVIVDDNSNDYNSSSHVFKTASCTGNKTLVYYSDSYDPDAFTVTSSYSGTKAVYTSRVVMQLVNCGSAACRVPAITSTTTTYQSGTVNWAGNGTAYEVAYKTTAAANWSAEIPVTTSSYTFTGLQPSTVYMFRVRQNCTADSLGYSNWATGSFVTDSLPCLPPDSLTVLGTTNATATFGWTARGNETAWDIRVFNTSIDTLYTVTTNPATVSGLTAGVTYYAAIRALCGNAQNIPGDWSDSIQFATQVCPTVTGVTSSNVTFNSVTLNWTAAALAQGYEVEYGMTGFTQGNGTRVTTTTNSITVNGLMDETGYQFFVRAVCGTNWQSENWSTPVTVTTGSIVGTTYNITTTVNPTNAGSVTGSGLYSEGDTATLTATANTGYTFSRWNDNVTANPRSVIVTSDSNFTAFFTRNQYTVTVTSADQTRGTVTGNGTYYYGDTATLTATAAAGYHFTQWNDGDTHATRSIVVTRDTTFTASFGVNQYTVTATANDASMGTVTGGGQYNFRDTATLTATARTGFYFQRWNDGNVDNPRTFVVTGDVSLTAIFVSDSVPPVQNYTVTLHANDDNMGIVNGAGTFAEGTSVEISAIANAGYRFVNWNDGVTDNPRTFVLTCDTTFTANFAEQVDSSAVLVVSFDGEMGYVLINGNEAGSYNGTLGDEVSLRAVAYDGYHFVEWSDGETAAERTIVLEQSRTTLTATFAIGSGIATVEGNASCLIYPNPATSSTTISVSGVNGKVRIAVVDINGRVAASETMECAGDCVKTMNVDNLSQGAYFVRITGEKVNMVKKLIVR